MINDSSIINCIIDKDIALGVLKFISTGRTAMTGALVTTSTGTGEVQTRILKYFANDDACWINL